MRRRDVLELNAYLSRWSSLHVGYDPRSRWVVRDWLTVAYFCARPLARRGMAPDLITAAGGLLAVGVPIAAWRGGWWALAAALLALGTGFFDSLDGAVAAISDRVTPGGYVLDSMTDRMTDACLLLALWLLGAPAWLCVAGGFVTMACEYLRARADNAGLGELSVVTLAERPTRIILAALAFCGSSLTSDAVAASLGATLWLGTGAVGFAQMSCAVRRHLRRS